MYEYEICNIDLMLGRQAACQSFKQTIVVLRELNAVKGRHHQLMAAGSSCRRIQLGLG